MCVVPRDGLFAFCILTSTMGLDPPGVKDIWNVDTEDIAAQKVIICLVQNGMQQTNLRKPGVTLVGEKTLYRYSSLPVFGWISVLRVLILKNPDFPAPSRPEFGSAPSGNVVRTMVGTSEGGTLKYAALRR